MCNALEDAISEAEPRREEIAAKLLGILAKAGRKAAAFHDVIRRACAKEESRELAEAVLEELCRQGRVVKVKGGRLALPEKRNLRAGTIQAHPQGFAFLLAEDPAHEDLYLSPVGLRPAMHGDRALALVDRAHGRVRPQGKVTKVLARGLATLVGTYYQTGKGGKLVPADARICYHVAIPPGCDGGARDGDVVEARITKYPTLYSDIEAKVDAVLGPAADPRVDTEVVMRKFGLSTEFPREVAAEGAKLPAAVDAGAIPKTEALPPAWKKRVAWHELPQPEPQRLDLRPLTLVTIDGENARDFDDAVGVVETEGGGCRLIVAIADVAHYVSPGSPMDEEARRRGTSVYFPDRAVPMFPEPLSDGIASLNPGVDRLALAVILDFDKSNHRLGAYFRPAIVQSRARLTYTQVKQILDLEEQEVRARNEDLLEDLERMASLAEGLSRRRMRRGSLDFDLPEAEIVLDLRGHPENIVRAERTIAHRMIEEFMIAANEAVAEYLTALSVPTLYRIHEPPDEDTTAQLARFLAGFGITLTCGPRGPSSQSFQEALRTVRGKPEERLVNTLILRSMKQARYSATNAGHFGLASKCYTHFTSPIRRYPDLIVHRQLARSLARKREEAQRQAQSLGLLADLASERERLAMEAEREVVDLKKAQFMRDKVGEQYEGFITGVTPFGIFVGLTQYYVEGLVHISTLLDDYYDYDEEKYCLRGRRRRRLLRLGDRVAVRVASVNLERRQIDFSLVNLGAV